MPDPRALDIHGSQMPGTHVTNARLEVKAFVIHSSHIERESEKS